MPQDEFYSTVIYYNNNPELIKEIIKPETIALITEAINTYPEHILAAL